MGVKNFLKRKQYLLIKSSKLLMDNPNKCALIILFDALFLVSFFVLQILFRYFADSILISRNAMGIYSYYSLVLAYFLAVLFAYSFFKYGMLNFIKLLFGRHSFSLGRLGKFYLLNIIISGIFFALMLLLGFLLAGIQQSYAPFIFILLSVPYLLILYVVVNLAQSLFYEGASIKKTIKESIKIIFTKIRDYRELILAMILAALFLWILLFGSGHLIRLAAGKNYISYLNLYKYFSQLSIISFYLVLYLVILINRISFYHVAKKCSTTT